MAKQHTIQASYFASAVAISNEVRAQASSLLNGFDQNIMTDTSLEVGYSSGLFSFEQTTLQNIHLRSVQRGMESKYTPVTSANLKC